MKKGLERLLALALCASLLLTALPAPSWAEEAPAAENTPAVEESVPTKEPAPVETPAPAETPLPEEPAQPAESAAVTEAPASTPEASLPDAVEAPAAEPVPAENNAVYSPAAAMDWPGQGALLFSQGENLPEISPRMALKGNQAAVSHAVSGGSAPYEIQCFLYTRTGSEGGFRLAQTGTTTSGEETLFPAEAGDCFAVALVKDASGAQAAYASDVLHVPTRDESAQETAQAWVQEMNAASLKNDGEKALWLYRKLAKACAPDKSAEAAQDAYAALVEGKAGSTGYALAYALLLDTASISNAVITGEGESWNALKLEDEWYHADAFCGEFAQDVEDFFGLTDEAMAPSHKWKREDAPRCQGTKYNFRVFQQDYLPVSDAAGLKTALESAVSQKNTTFQFYFAGDLQGKSLEQLTAEALSGLAGVNAQWQYREWYAAAGLTYFDVVQRPLTALTLDKTQAELWPGQQLRLQPGFQPADTDDTLIWQSDDPAVAQVENGLVTACAPGVTTVRCLSKYDNQVQAACEIQVLTDQATAVIPAAWEISLGAKDTTSLAGWSLQPAYARGSVTYSSSNAKIATVDASGKVTGKRQGVAYITLKAASGASCQVKVTVLRAPSSVRLSMARTTLGVGETQATSYTLSRGSLGSVRYTSSNSGIAQVDAEGNVTGLRPGKCTITIRTHNGRTARVKITIVATPTSVSFASTEMTMGTDQVARLGCKIQPVAVGSVRYTSSNPAVIYIDEAAGTATAVGLGTAVVTAETYNHVVGSCTVTVLRGPDSVSLSMERTVLGRGEKMAIAAAFQPVDAFGGVTYTTSNKRICTVSADGLVTAKKNGTAVITATTHNGKTAQITVKVVRAPSSVKFTLPHTKLGVGESTPGTVSLSRGSVGSYTFSSSNAAVATVDAAGNVTAVAPGKATITVTTFNRRKRSVKITVCPAPASISLSMGDSELAAGETGALTAWVNSGAAGKLTAVSSNPEVLTIDPNNGAFRAQAEGQATVTVSAYNGVSASLNFRVLPGPTYLRFASETVEIGLKDKISLTPEFTPDTRAILTWKTQNKRIATVDRAGNITGVRQGSTVITVQSQNGLTASIKVTVRKAPKSVSPLPASMTLGVGETGQLSARFPAGSAGSLRFESLDASIATVDAAGRVTGVKAGSTRIRITTYNKKTCYADVTILLPPDQIWISVPAQMGVGQQYKIGVTLPEGTGSPISYTVYSGDAVSVQADGTITAQKPGTATLRVGTYLPSVYADAVIQVLPAPSYLKLDAEQYVTDVDKPISVQVSVEEGAYNVLTFQTSDASIFTVDGSGLITPVRRGQAVLTVTACNGLSVSAAVQVLDPYYPDSVALTNTPLYLNKGETFTPVLAVNPESALPDLVWASSSPAIAAVDASTGVVTGVSYGRVTITAVSGRNPDLQIKYTLIVLSDGRCLVMPLRRTGTGEISANLARISRVKESAYREIESLQARGVISASDAKKRRSIVSAAFDMYAFPWMTTSVQSYWKAANSEGGAKDFKPGIVYYGMPYISSPWNNRLYNVSKALSEKRYTDSGKGYYLMNRNNLLNKLYCGSDCSSFCSMAIWGVGSSHAGDKTGVIATSSAYKTIRDYGDLRPGDLLCRSGRHVVMFLYYANAAKTQIVIIEQGGTEAAINTCSTSIKDIGEYSNNSYVIRRLKSLN